MIHRADARGFAAFMCLAGEGREPSGVARRMALRASAIRGGYQ